MANLSACFDLSAGEPQHGVQVDGWHIPTQACVFALLTFAVLDWTSAKVSSESTVAEKVIQVGQVFLATCNLVFTKNYAWGYDTYGWFFYAKIYSVAICTFVMMAGRQSQSQKTRLYVAYSISAMLFANIAEAMLADLPRGRYANFIAGFVVLLGIPHPHSTTYVTHDPSREGSKRNSFAQAYTVEWATLYFVWNANFGYSWKINSASNLIHVSVSYLLCLSTTRWDLWMQYRAYSLNTHFMGRVLFAPFTTQAMFLDIYIPEVALAGELLTLAVCVYYANAERLHPTNNIGHALLSTILRSFRNRSTDERVEEDSTVISVSDLDAALGGASAGTGPKHGTVMPSISGASAGPELLGEHQRASGANVKTFQF